MVKLPEAPRVRNDECLSPLEIFPNLFDPTTRRPAAAMTTMPGPVERPTAPADLSAAWFRELELVGTYASSGDAFPQALELVGHDAVARIAKSVASYPLHRWREALDHAHSAGGLGTVKVAFSPGSTS